MISIVIAVMIVIAPALAPYFFQFLMAPVGLPAVFAVTLPRNAEFFFSFMDAPFATLVAIGAGWRRRSQ